MIPHTFDLSTSSGFYKAVLMMSKQHANTDISLEHYLCALLSLLAPLEYKESFTPQEFLTLLEKSFTIPPLAYNPEWVQEHATPFPREINHRMLISLLKRQIVDLHEMQEAGTLDNELRYYGITAPRGWQWYNFDATTYLECGMCGHFGGWDVDDDDDSGRILVSGSVAVLDDEGTVHSADPQDSVSPISSLDALTWHDWAEFLECGSNYE